ncbi:uncharacterized protein [Rutidosis leptorrhynchoides]|uniref:uncharacterized protein n=1 Tax=Rutidosis leptorrhynchoides TaxID=125765 RepID=UPI003A9A0CC0
MGEANLKKLRPLPAKTDLFVPSVYLICRNTESIPCFPILWAGDFKLREKFPRLFRLEVDKGCCVQDRIYNNGTGNFFSWNWAREPVGRTGTELNQMVSMLESLQINRSSSESWSWCLSPSGNFTVKSLSILIDDGLITLGGSTPETLRNHLAPKKVEIFVWRAIKKRIPVRSELDKKGIDLHSVRCPLCDDGVETVDHSIIFCKYSMDLLCRVYQWWGLGNFSNLSVAETLQGNNGASMSSLGKSIWQATEWVCAYYLWKNRNNKVFRGKCWPTSVLLNEIKVKAFDWIFHRLKKKKLNWLTWLNNPNTYLTLS